MCVASERTARRRRARQGEVRSVRMVQIRGTGGATNETSYYSALENLLNEVRLQLHALASNLANFMRTLALLRAMAHWSLITLREKLVKIGARMVRHGCYVTFQMAELAVSGRMLGQILARTAGASVTQAAITKGNAAREACLDDGENGHQHRETAIGDGAGGKWSTLLTCVGFSIGSRIAVESQNGYSNGQNRGPSGECRITIAIANPIS